MANVHVFTDAPHTLQLIRNWLVDKGFLLTNADVGLVTKEPIEALINLKDNFDLKTVHRLTKNHIYLEKTQGHNVRKAAQLLSHTTAMALQFTL